MITTVTTMMISMVVAPSLGGILVGCGVLLLTGTVVAPSLWGILVGCGVLLVTGTVVVSSGVDAMQAKHTTWYVTQQTEI